MRGRLLALLLAVCLGCLAVPGMAEDREGCLDCHDLAGFARPTEGGIQSLSVDGPSFDASPHGALGCRSCHREVISLPHQSAVTKVNCGLDCHVADRETGKPYSHEALYWAFVASVHGRDNGPAIGCTLCHPRNPSPERERTAPIAGTSVCGSCHPGKEGTPEGAHGYAEDVHGRTALAGSADAPGCPDCHTQHGVLPAEDAESSVSAGRLPETCGRSGEAGERSCHRRAATAGLVGMSPLQGRPGGGFLTLVTGVAALLLASRMIAEALRRP